MNDNDKDYETLIYENIYKANLLKKLNDKTRNKIILLLQKKEEIIKKNGFFATFQINSINNKIDKLSSNKKNFRIEDTQVNQNQANANNKGNNNK